MSKIRPPPTGLARESGACFRSVRSEWLAGCQPRRRCSAPFDPAASSAFGGASIGRFGVLASAACAAPEAIEKFAKYVEMIAPVLAHGGQSAARS